MARNVATQRSLGGRPVKLTDDLIAEITLPIRTGTRADTAAAAAGVARDTFHAWLTEGSRLRHSIAGDPGFGAPPDRLTAEQSRLIRLSDAVAEAWAINEARASAALYAAYTAPQVERRTRTVSGEDGKATIEEVVVEKPADWRAAAWMLEHAHGLVARQQIDVTGEVSGSLTLEVRAAAAAERVRELKSSRPALPAAPEEPEERAG